MTGRSHLLIGGFTLLCAMRWHWLETDPLSVFSGLLGSLLPDVDTERSMLGARCKPISRFVARTFGHRGMTHSGVMLLTLTFLASEIWGASALRGPLGALILGIATHIAADLPTGGCQLLAPLSRSHLSFWPYVRTGGLGEVMLLLPILLALGWAGISGPVPELRIGANSSGWKSVTHHRRLHEHATKDIFLLP